MKLGLITDIHEHVEYLRAALHRLRHDAVEQIIFIGDAFFTGERIEETVELLVQNNVIGVWGNHDRGSPLTGNQQFSTIVMDFLANLKPRLELVGCLSTHVLNPESRRFGKISSHPLLGNAVLQVVSILP